MMWLATNGAMQHKERQQMSANELCFLTARELAGRMRAGQLSALEVMEAHLAQIERVNPQVNAIVTLVAERALAGARQAGPST